MFFNSSNASLTYANIFGFIVEWCAKHNTPFTVSQMVDDAVNTLGNVTADGRKYMRGALTRKLKRLVDVGCLSYTHNPAPQPNDYEITSETLNILTDPTITDKIAALENHFDLIEFPSRALPAPTKQKLLFEGKKPGTSKEATAMRQNNNTIPYTMPNGATINFDSVEKLAEFVLRLGGVAALPAPAQPVDVVDFRSTVSAVLRGQAEALKNTIAKLAADARAQNKRVSLRFLSLALSQWDRFIAGVKYDISYNFCVTADDVPCNVDDCDTVSMTDDIERRMCDYLTDLVEVAELERRRAPSDAPIVLPSMQAANESGTGVEKTPCAFRSQSLVKWDFKGKALPAHLKAKLPVRETPDDA